MKRYFRKIFTHFSLFLSVNFIFSHRWLFFPQLSPLKKWYCLKCRVISWLLFLGRRLLVILTLRCFSARRPPTACHRRFLVFPVSLKDKNASHSWFPVSQYIKLLDPLTSSPAFFFLAAYRWPQYYFALCGGSKRLTLSLCSSKWKAKAAHCAPAAAGRAGSLDLMWTGLFC